MSIAGVFSRNTVAMNELAEVLQTQAVKNFDKHPKADITILAVADSAIQNVANQLPPNPDTLVVHCSGITPLSALSSHPRSGVFYPLQSLNKNKEVNWENVPLLLEAVYKKDEQFLLNFAEALGLIPRVLNSEQRQYLHLAAVFANNFSNRMYAIAFEIAKLHGIEPELLYPLIEETAAKIYKITPQQAQTGPARRRDSATIETHVELLRQHPQYRQLYEIMSRSIIESYQAESK